MNPVHSLILTRVKLIQSFRVGIELRRAGCRWKGYQARSFDCELGSHFHHGYVFEGPPVMPDGRISQVRFEALAYRP
jgi:hypothetical protein